MYHAKKRAKAAGSYTNMSVKSGARSTIAYRASESNHQTTYSFRK
jgi:hypothetical protein